MLFTKASEYALLSMICIAGKEESMDVDSISSELGISRSFLAKILQNSQKIQKLKKCSRLKFRA